MLLTAVAMALLIVGGVGAAFGVELPTRPTLAGPPAEQSEPPVEAQPPVPVQPLPDPTPPTTAPATPAHATAAPTAPVPGPPRASGGTGVSFTIVAGR